MIQQWFITLVLSLNPNIPPSNIIILNHPFVSELKCDEFGMKWANGLEGMLREKFDIPDGAKYAGHFCTDAEMKERMLRNRETLA